MFLPKEITPPQASSIDHCISLNFLMNLSLFPVVISQLLSISTQNYKGCDLFLLLTLSPLLQG